MRILVACLFVVSASLPVAQSSRELRSHYGEPDIERFTARPGIGLTVEYGSDGLACQIVIEPKQPLVHKEQPPAYMSPEVVSELIDEVAPRDIRGRKLNTVLESMGCAEGSIEEYENVWISRSTDECLPLKPERERPARVVFKRQTCPTNPFSLTHN